MLTTVAEINGNISKVWDYYNNPEHVTKWAFASSDWCCPKASSDLRVGGRFNTRMESVDGKQGFDFSGTYTKVEPESEINYTMDGEGARAAVVKFEALSDSLTKVTVMFDKENENPEEMQIAGWQAILNNFKKYAETIR